MENGIMIWNGSVVRLLYPGLVAPNTWHVEVVKRGRNSHHKDGDHLVIRV